MVHNIFIAWSGEVSRRIAETMHEWLPSVIQAAQPFMSEKDVDAGKRGLDEIAQQLSEIKVGILCLTADNQRSSWINYEAGSLSKLNDQQTFVIPLAFDLEHGQVKNPIGQFQSKQFVSAEMKQVVVSINKAIGTPLPDERLNNAFEKHWDDLAARIDVIRNEAPSLGAERAPRSSQDMLEELIVAAREQGEFVRQIVLSPARPRVMNAHNDLTEVALRRLAKEYGESGAMSLTRLREISERLDSTDWGIIDESPFLVWYLERYAKIFKPADDLGDVPF